jgi:hypothetical protein
MGNLAPGICASLVYCLSEYKKYDVKAVRKVGVRDLTTLPVVRSFGVWVGGGTVVGEIDEPFAD